MADIKTYKVNGDVYDIPEDKTQEFLSQFPDATEVQSFIVEKDTFDIPLDKVDSFKEEYPEAQTLTATKEKKKPYMKDWFQKIGGAALGVAEQVAKGEEFAEKLYDAPGEMTRYRLEQLGVGKETAEKIGDLTNTFKFMRPDYWGLRMGNKVNEAVRDTEGFKRLNEEAERLKEESQRYDKTITELLKDKDYDAAFGAIMLTGAESLPLSMVAAFGGPAGLATLGFVAGAEKYDELSERDDMDEAVKMGVSIAIGGLETVTEMMGTAKIGGLIKSAWKGAGKEATIETVKAGLGAWFKGMYKKAGVYFAPVQEGIEEGVNQLGGNIVARASGEDPERKLLDGVLDSFLGGMGGGTYFTAAGGMGKAVNGIKKRFESEIKPEEKVAPEAAKEPQTDKEKIPKVPKEQPAIGKYQIGEQDFETKEEFLAEVETYKGKEDTPKITVTDDQSTLDEVNKILTIKEEPSHASKIKKGVEETGQEQSGQEGIEETGETAPKEEDVVLEEQPEGKPPPDSPDHPKWVTENSEDVDEIAAAHTRLKEEGEQTLEPWQEEFLTAKVNPESFDTFMDKNLREPIMARNWFDKKRDPIQGYDKGYDLDQIAADLSDTHGVEITPQMLGDYMLKNQDKRTGVQKGLTKRLEQKYKRLTNGDNIADYYKAVEEEGTLEKLQDISSLDELINEDGSLNIDAINDKIDNDPEFFKGFRVDFTDEEIAELKNIINDDTRRKEFEDAIKATRTIQEQIIGETVEPSEERDAGEVAEEPEPGDVSELAARASEITKTFGLSGFRATEGKEGTRSELAKEDITNWLNREEQVELRKAKDEKAKAEVSKKFDEQRSLISKAKARDEGAVRSILHDFLQRNRKALTALHGRAIPTIISRVNDKATTFVQLSNIMEYINDAFASEAQKQKKVTVGKIIEEADPAKKLEVKKGAKRAKSAYLNRLTDENIKQSEAITEQIERMDPMAVEAEIDEINDKIATLQEKKGDPKEIEALEDQRDILEFGRIWEMSQTELDRALAEMQRINKVGRSQAKQGRIARAMKGARMRTALNNIIGHPAFRRAASQLKQKGFFKKHFSTFDVDFPALLNQMERIVGKNFKWQWDNALSADNRLDINTEKLGKHKETYENIERDVENLKTSLNQQLEEIGVGEFLGEEIKVINKKNVESFIDNWYDYLPEESQKTIDDFTKSIEDKYNTIFKETNAWLKATFSTGPLQRMFHTDLVRKGEEAVAQDWFNFEAKLAEGVGKILGLKGGKLTRKMIELREKPSVSIPYIDQNGDTAYEMFTPMQAVHKWLEYKMGDRMTNFTAPAEMHKEGGPAGGMGWNDESFAALEEAMTPELKKLGDLYVKTYAEIVEQIQPAYLNQYGTTIDLIENYVPSLVVPTGSTTDVGTLLDTKDVVRGVSSDRFKRRRVNQNPLANVDALDMLRNYAADMIRFKNMSEPVRKLEYAFLDPNVKNHIEQALSSEHYSQVMHYIDRWAGRNQRQNIALLDEMLSNVSKGMLGLKLAVGFKQTYSSLQYAADPSMSMRGLIKGIAEMAIPTKLNKAVIRLLDKQPYFVDRIGAMRGLDMNIDVYSGTFDFMKDTEKGSSAKQAFRKFLKGKSKLQSYIPQESFENFYMMFLKYGDRFPAVVGGGAYLKNKYKHFSRGQKLTADVIEKYNNGEKNQALDRALEEWSIMSEATQQSTRMSKVSNFRASGSIARAITQFTSGPAQLARNTFNAIRNIKRGQDVMGNLKAVVVSHFVSGALYGIADMGFKLDDDEEKKEYMWRILISNLRGIAIGGRLLSVALDVRFDKPWQKNTLTQVPVASELTDLMTSTVSLILADAMNLSKEDKEKSMRKLVESIATLRGIPIDEMIDIVQVIEEAKQGEADVMELLMLRNPGKTKKVKKYYTGTSD